MIDRLFNNRYEIRAKLGSGGTALVYKGYDTVLGRLVTIKLLREEFSSDSDLVNRFRREAQAVASLSHGNIVNVYDVGYEGALPFIVMEYVEGETLKEYIKGKGVLPVDESVQLICQILDAVEYAHQHHIIHRDIKPQNILFAKDGRIKVTDFGIAVGISDVTQTYTTSSRIMGSVHYISPEQVQGLVATEKSDIYSVGVVLYEMLTGELPYTGDTPISIAMQHVQGELKIPHHVNPQVPVGLSYVVMRAMRKAPDVRYHSAQEMKESILSVYEGVNLLYKPAPESEEYLEHTRELKLEEPPKKLARFFKGNPPRQEEELEEILPLEQSPRERSPRTRGASARRKQLDVKRVVIFASILLFAVLMILGGQLFRTIFSNEEIPVPDLKGIPLEEAVETLTELGLQYTTMMRTDAEVEENHIISQDIPPEQMVRKNRSIELTVSQGPRESEVPKLVGQTLTNAEIMLANRFLEAEVSEEFHTLVPLGEVIEQYPPEGSMLPESSIVRIVVSKGPRLTMVKMPDVVGMDIAEARKELDAKQIFISKLDSEESTAYAQGVVLKQSVAKDKEIQEGSSVELTISDGPGPTAKIATVEYLIPNDGEEHTFRIVVEDATGSHEPYHAKLLPGTNVSEVISFQNKAKVLLYLDGVMVYAEDVE